MRFLFVFLRYASLIIVGVTALVIGREVAGAFSYLEGIHPVLAWAFLVLFFAALGWFVGRPMVRFWRVPVALCQPRMPGKAETLEPRSFAPVSELLNGYIENGGRIGICPPCGKTHGLTEDNVIDSTEWMGAVAMLEHTSGWRTLSF